MSDYIAVKSGERLERRSGAFYYRDRYFTGLVDTANNALYDDPEDSFADHVGIESSLDSGLIRPDKDIPAEIPL